MIAERESSHRPYAAHPTSVIYSPVEYITRRPPATHPIYEYLSALSTAAARHRTLAISLTTYTQKCTPQILAEQGTLFAAYLPLRATHPSLWSNLSSPTTEAFVAVTTAKTCLHFTSAQSQLIHTYKSLFIYLCANSCGRCCN